MKNLNVPPVVHVAVNVLRTYLGLEETAFPLARRSITKSKIIICLVSVQYIAN